MEAEGYARWSLRLLADKSIELGYIDSSFQLVLFVVYIEHLILLSPRSDKLYVLAGESVILPLK